MVKERIETLLKQLKEGIFEKDEVMALALLSSIAGESIFLLGPPGVAKSLIARRLKFAYKDAKVFEYLMSRFSTPDEIFGPVKISMLKEDKYERVVEGYLPSAEVVFLDEIWKAGPSIQNALLTVINEKIYRNGKEVIDPIPMKALISASNELPSKEQEKGQSLEALWDRFLIRYEVLGIEVPEKFNEMIKMPSKQFDEKNIRWSITDDDYTKWNEEIDKINVSENILNVIDNIRKKIENFNRDKEKKEKLYVSDRRWRKIVRLLRASAFLNDRNEVDLMDCFLIKHCIWNEEEQIQTVSNFVNEAIRDYGPTVDMDFSSEREQFSKFKGEIERNTSKKVGDKPIILQDSKGAKFYRLLESFYSNYVLISIDNVDNVSDTYTEIKIYSEKWDEMSAYIKKSGEKNSVKLSRERSYDCDDYKIKTEPDRKPYKKSPEERFFNGWNDDFSKLLAVLEKKKKDIENFWKTSSDNFYNNIFVSKTLADDHVKSKIDNIEENIDELVMDIKKVRNAYTEIYKPNEI